jgi:ligand-binding SRPBCC domain-containing protein
MPAWMHVRIEREKIVPPPASELSVLPPDADVSRIAGAGSELEASYRAIPGMPMRIRSVAIITAFSLNHFFEDIQGKGPFKSWHHRHEFAAETRDGVLGTLIRDLVDYELAFGSLGTLADALFIAPQMNRTFVQRQKKVAQLLVESASNPS